MAKDLHFSSVVLAMHMDGANGSTTFTDLKGRVLTRYGNAQISTAQSKFGGSSLYLDGNGDYLVVPASTDFLFTGDFTIEAWVYPTAGSDSIIGMNGSVIALKFGGDNKFRLYANGWSIGSASADALNTWHHVAVSRSGSTVRMYVNGVQVATTTDSGNIGSSSSPLRIGTDTEFVMFAGYIDDLRVTKGVARYTAGFTPPTEPFPDSGYAVGGTVIDSNANPVARTLRVYRRDTGALLASGTSSPVTGAYNIDVAYDQEVNVVMLDDALGTLENDQILRTTPV